MNITAIVDRFEGRKAILLSSEFGMEIYIPSRMIRGKFSEGERISLSLNGEFIPEFRPVKEGNFS